MHGIPKVSGKAQIYLMAFLPNIKKLGFAF
jgi:hypothetical protein